MPGWKAVSPKDDHGYLDLMSRAIFSAGLNWRMIEKKWPHFRKAFRDFSPEKVARLSERDIGALMEDSGIVRNEKKIRATVENAKTILDLAKEHGSVKGYIAGFGKRKGSYSRIFNTSSSTWAPRPPGCSSGRSDIPSPPTKRRSGG